MGSVCELFASQKSLVGEFEADCSGGCDLLLSGQPAYLACSLSMCRPIADAPACGPAAVEVWGSGGLISGSLSPSPHESDPSSSQSQCALRREVRPHGVCQPAASIIEY